ncbi:MAG: asparagine synthase (glutamine-hydrolyzing), partial [Coleofasciculus sp. C2-GNP5-27]
MCGFAGFSNPKEDARSVLAAMLGSITYRGPDQAGCYFDHSLALGHLRLTIINPEGGEQPRVDRDSGDALAFNGEIYGYRRHAAELQKQGLPLRDQSDTEVLFCMLRHYGIEETLKKIDGMFAFAFRDGKTGAVYLARDKFGEKPLYYSFNNGCFVFASEVKSIKTHPACRQAPFDPEAISQYLTYEFVPEQKSFYSGISKLLPAHYLKFYKNNLEITSYWQQSFKGNKDAPAHVLSEEACINQLDSLLTSSVRDRLIADVPIGVFLSGGVDSILISALAVRCAPDITAFSIQIPEFSYEESHYARRVAE